MTDPRLRTLTARELLAALERDGFEWVGGTGSHRVYRRENRTKVVVTFHAPGATFKPKTLKAMLDAAGWKTADLRRLGLIRR